MSPARFSIQQVVLVNLLFVVFILAGAVVYTLLPVDVYPDTSMDLATIYTVWPGASAEDVERLVTRVIEEEIEDVTGQERLVSHSLADLSSIGVKFREDLTPAELEKAFDELRLALDRVTELPDGCEEPELNRITLDDIWPLVQVAIASEEAEEAVLRRVALDLKKELRLIDGISRVREVAIRDRELHVLLDRDRLEQHGLSIHNVADALRQRNLNVPAGVLESAAQEVNLRSVGEVDRPQELEDFCVVPSATGAHLFVRDLGQVEEAFERRYWSASYCGQPCCLLYITKERSANALTVREDVAACLERYRQRNELPGVELALTGDSTTMIASRLNVLKRNLGVGLVLVFCVLWMFVGARNSTLAIVGVPFSFLCAFIFLYAVNVSINAVSVFSLVLVSGIIVDDAIVVLENIYRHVQQGLSLKEAVIRGTDQVMWPVVSSTLTTVAAFLPLLLMPGVLGKFFAIVPKTVTVALLASLLECLIILPAHYLDWGPRRAPGKRAGLTDAPRPGSVRARFAGRFLAAYDVVLAQVLAHRYLAIGVVASAGLLTWQASRTLVKDLFPSDFPTFIVDFSARPGASLEETAQAAAGVYPILDTFIPDKVERYSAALGVQWDEDNQRLLRTNLAQMWVDVPQNDARYCDPSQVMAEVRQALTEYVAANPECGIEDLRVWPVRDGPPVGKPVHIRVEHPDYDRAQELADRAKARLRSIPGVYGVMDNLHLGPRELQLRLREAPAAELGVTYGQVAAALRGANDGLKVGVYKDTENDEDVDIKVRFEPDDLATLEAIHDIDVSGLGGRRVKLHQVADLRFDRSFAGRYHYNGQRAVTVTADLDADAGADAMLVNRAVLDELMPFAREDDRLKIHAGGQFVETERSFGGLRKSGIVAIALIYLILATQFRSYFQPAVVLLAIAFGVIGMVLGLVINGYPFTVVTAVAMVGLCGVVVNDALILLDFINRERRQGVDLKAALQTACRQRVRPIVLTTATTVFGLGPMAIGLGGYSKIWSPFAMSMCWGLVMATVLTLLLVPAFYHIIEDLQVWGRRLVRSEVSGRSMEEPTT